jgi:hypothetical protein
VVTAAAQLCDDATAAKGVVDRQQGGVYFELGAGITLQRLFLCGCQFTTHYFEKEKEIAKSSSIS